MSTEFLQHSRISLALHRLRDAPGRPLLLLHGLGEQSPGECPDFAAAWPGPVHALDFTGHGASTVPVGGGYTAEVLLADADTAPARGASSNTGRAGRPSPPLTTHGGRAPTSAGPRAPQRRGAPRKASPLGGLNASAPGRPGQAWKACRLLTGREGSNPSFSAR